MKTIKFKTVLSLVLFCIVTPSALFASIFDDAFDKVARTLPNGAVVALVMAGAIHVHPVCGDDINYGWSDDEEYMYKKLGRDLKDGNNKYKQVQLESWYEQGDPLSGEEQRWLIDQAAEEEFTHVLFYTTRTTYEWNRYEQWFTRDKKHWTLRLVDVNTKRTSRFSGGGGRITPIEPRLRVACPTHGNGY